MSTKRVSLHARSSLADVPKVLWHADLSILTLKESGVTHFGTWEVSGMYFMVLNSLVVTLEVLDFWCKYAFYIG